MMMIMIMVMLTIVIVIVILIVSAVIVIVIVIFVVGGGGGSYLRYMRHSVYPNSPCLVLAYTDGGDHLANIKHHLRSTDKASKNHGFNKQKQKQWKYFPLCQTDRLTLFRTGFPKGG